MLCHIASCFKITLGALMVKEACLVVMRALVDGLVGECAELIFYFNRCLFLCLEGINLASLQYSNFLNCTFGLKFIICSPLRK
jgi:hypothetical protein